MSCRLTRLVALLLAACFCVPGFCQREKYERYITKFQDLAIAQMRKYSIPASITMAQGLLESAAGTSTLATMAHNHFGIKVSGNWTGPYVLRNDDAPNEKFRKYARDEDSYEDHSLFLVRGRRYESLFKLSITDYRGWAYGLKAAGYATSPTYATNLIQIIEDYKLTELDQKALSKHHPSPAKDVNSVQNTTMVVSTPVQTASRAAHSIGVNNGSFYVIALSGDTYKSIAQEYDMSARKLRRYNEVNSKHVLNAGEIVYLEKKSSKAHKSYKHTYYELKAGESLYSVSQSFGVRVKTLYKLNGYAPEHQPRVGDKIRIR